MSTSSDSERNRELQPGDHPGRCRGGRGRRRARCASRTPRADSAADRRVVTDLDGERIDGADAGDVAAPPGRGSGAPVACEYSRATPRIENAYPRSGVTLISTAASSRPSNSIASVPTGASMPSVASAKDALVVVAEAESALRRSCRRRRGRRSCAPRSGTGRAAPSPAGSRRPCRRRRSCARRRRCRARPSPASAAGWPSSADPHLAPADGLAVGLRLLDELEHLAHDDRALSSKRKTSSSSKPTRTSASSTSSGVVPGRTSTYSRSHDSGTRIRPPFRTAR